MDKNTLDEYRECAEICSCNKNSVRKHNRAAKRMLKLTEQAVKEGSETIRLFASLLDDPVTREWLAYQLLEKSNLDIDIEDKCISVIKEIAASNIPVNSFAARNWLEKREAGKNS
jgi:hypothetical protein